MTFKFENLDPTTRKLMKEEVEFDCSTNPPLYTGKTLKPFGKLRYKDFLLNAIDSGTEHTLANKLWENDCFEAKEGIIAAEVLARSEFNRFYMRALCLRIIRGESGQLEVYRAREVSRQREESKSKIGQIIDPKMLLDDLRKNRDRNTDSGLGLPNSGISVRIKK